MEKEILSYRTVYENGTAEIIEKKSRFIADIHAVESEEEAIAFVEQQRKKYYDARHVCYAYVIGKDAAIMRFSDDGEPGGTAGKPMLDILLNEDLTNVVVTVTRYFGGILLGTGGLVRAYTGATKEGIQCAKVGTMILMSMLCMEVPYDLVGKVKYVASNEQAEFVQEDYGEKVFLQIAIPKDGKEALVKKIVDASAGRVAIEEKNECYYMKK